MGDTVVNLAIEISRFAFVLIALFVLLRVVDNSLAELNMRRRLKRGMRRYFGDLTVVEAKTRIWWASATESNGRTLWVVRGAVIFALQTAV